MLFLSLLLRRVDSSFWRFTGLGLVPWCSPLCAISSSPNLDPRVCPFDASNFSFPDDAYLSGALTFALHTEEGTRPLDQNLFL